MLGDASDMRMKSVGRLVRSLAVALLIAPCVFLGCKAKRSASEAVIPARPTNVPTGAAWVGGADGGAFVVISHQATDPRHVYRGQVFHDTGSLWYSGRLSLEPPGSEPVTSVSPGLFTGWDGEALYLADGRSLTAMKAAR